ncbi:MAG: putative toxin-antitoxin system toxin component, PIN family [Anaerolineae bacterium]|nr:putative toxin-antitoxin system toxin component, PIN family [Anaerolineae bacterium]
MPIRAVLDTNVLVSGLVAEQGPPRQILDAWLEGLYTLVTSLYLVEELVHVLSYPRIAERLRLDEEELAAILAALLSTAEVSSGRLRLPGVTRDPKDDFVVACARGGGGRLHRQRRPGPAGAGRVRRHPGRHPAPVHGDSHVS